jgi:nitrous oxidase accessory protein NosD
MRLYGTLVLSLAAGALIVAPTPALAATHVVHPGESIQAAVDAASPGDTVRVQPGTYHEAVLVQTDGIFLRGGGPGNYTTIVAPRNPTANACALGGPAPLGGICVLGQMDASGNPSTPVTGVRIRGFQVKGFVFGIFNFNGSGTQIQQNRLASNQEYGVFSNTSTGTRIVDNVALNNGEAGFYVGDSPEANAFVFRNESSGNVNGFFFRDASHGLAKRNNAHGNCIGILMLDTDSPGGVSNWDIRSNTVRNNTQSCPSDEGPPTSGLGIAAVGVTDSVIFGNTVTGNTPSGDSVFSGGIVLVDGAIAGGGPLANDRVQANQAHGNTPDLLWDGSGSGILFLRNACETSSPDGLCAAA